MDKRAELDLRLTKYYTIRTSTNTNTFRFKSLLNVTCRQKGSKYWPYKSGIQLVSVRLLVGPVFRCNSNFEPFNNWEALDHLKTKQVQYLDPQWGLIPHLIGKR